MRIEEITKSKLSDATDLELKQLRYKSAKFWDRHFKNNSNEIVGCFTRIDFISKYRLLLKEMDDPQRSLQHSTCDIDRQAFKQSMQTKADGIDLAPFCELVAKENCILIEEDFVKSDEVKIIVRAMEADSVVGFLEENRDQIANIIKEQLNKTCNFTYDSDFEGSGIPLYHQVLIPVSKIEKVEIKNEGKETKEVGKSLEIVPIEKGDEQIVYGIVYEPDTKDAQGDQANEEEIRKAAYTFMENAQAFKVMHKGKKVKVSILENYIAPCDFEVAKRKVKKGSWVLVTRVLDKKLWQEIKQGKLTGYSMAGYAKVE